MKITDIEQQKHNSERYSIYIDNKFAFGLEAIDVLNFRLKAGDEISPDKYNIITQQGIYAKARDKAIKLLGFKARTEAEIIRRLKDEEYSDEIIEKVTSFLKQYGYIDDESYARAFIKEKFTLKGYSAKRLSYELKLKGIGSDIITSAVRELKDENVLDEKNMAVELLRKKLKGETNTDDKQRKRLYGFLARRGYSCSDIKYAFNKVFQEDFEC